ncbi:MAG: hypothetical protein RL757_2047 [Bacteroidota bacterium]|jgi:RimJ/RimL family protein N-acetyltransferase
MEINWKTILEDDLVRLRPLVADDFEALFAVAADPNIWAQHPQKDRYKRDVFIETSFKGALIAKAAFVVIDKKTNEIIGSSRFDNFDEKKNEIEIGWTFLACRYWGGTYNRAMKTLMIDHALQFVENVIFNVGDKNLRSQLAMKKLGATDITTADSRPETVVFCINKTNWK